MATDNRLIISNSVPEGFIEAPKGTFYINTGSSSVYVKLRGDASTSSGWSGLICKGFYHGDGSPELVVIAPNSAYYHDEENNSLYVHLTDSISPDNIGWVPLTENNVITSSGNPYDTSLSGNKGDIYIDTESATLYVHNGNDWVRLSLLNANNSDVLTNLSELLTNITEICSSYYNLFVNPVPMDISVSQYDNEGILQTYIIPNRAKDRQVEIGNLNPNGEKSSVLGSLYLNALDRTLYIKTTDESSSDGWKVIIYGDKVQEPLYVDENNKLCIRMDNTPVEHSQNLINSGAIYSALENKADKNGSSDKNFNVAYPVENNNAVNLEFIKSLFTNNGGTVVLNNDVLLSLLGS